MPSWAEVLGNGAIRRQKALGMARRFKSLHTTLALACRTMRILAPVIEVAALTVFDSRQYLALGCAITFELIRNDDSGHIRQALEELPEELLRGPLVTPTLDEDIQDVVVLIYRAPQVMTFAVNRQKDLIQVPFVSRSGTPVAQLIRILLAKLPTPFPDRFVGHRDATFEQQFFHIAVAQGEAIGEPDPVADDFSRKAVILVTLGVGRRGHAWLPILGFMCSVRAHRWGIMSWTGNQGQQLDNADTSDDSLEDATQIHEWHPGLGRDEHKECGPQGHEHVRP
jgi:hypothetical protein